MPTKITVPTGSTPTLVSAARNRQFIVIQNQGSADVYLGLDHEANAVTVNSGSKPGYKLGAGDTFVLSADIRHPVPAFSMAIYAVHADASSHSLSVQEV